MASRASRSQKKKGVFKNLTIAATGDFGPQKTHEDIKRWVENNGGTFATTVDSRTTHLIATSQHYKRKVKIVRDAKEARIKIVDFDWLEDSTRSNAKKPESKYSWRKAARMAFKDQQLRKKTEKETRKQEHEEVTEQFHKGCRAALEDISSGKSDLKVETVGQYGTDAVAPDNHHIYQDSTGFDYDVTLARLDLENNRNEHYQLKLYESHTTPNTYATCIKLFRPQEKTFTGTLAEIGSNFFTAFEKFQKFFRTKCGKHWSQRLEKPKHAQANVAGAVLDEQETAEEKEIRRVYGELAKNPETKIIDVKAFLEEEARRLAAPEAGFMYLPPEPGKPVGVFPDQFGPIPIRPAGRDVALAQEDDAKMRLE